MIWSYVFNLMMPWNDTPACLVWYNIHKFHFSCTSHCECIPNNNIFWNKNISSIIALLLDYEYFVIPPPSLPCNTNILHLSSVPTQQTLNYKQDKYGCDKNRVNLKISVIRKGKKLQENIHIKVLLWLWSESGQRHFLVKVEIAGDKMDIENSRESYFEIF